MDVFDLYCTECFGAFASYRSLHDCILCDDCTSNIVALCEQCSQNLAELALDGYKVCTECAVAVFFG